MMRPILATLLGSVLLVAAPRAAAAETLVVYDTVDAVDTTGGQTFRITGIIAGESAPSFTFYSGGSVDGASQCDRKATLAMAKPGKFQLVLVRVFSSTVECRLRLRAP